jgi:hypothetical protein
MKNTLFGTAALICLTAVTLACGAKTNGSPTATTASASTSTGTSPSSSPTTAADPASSSDPTTGTATTAENPNYPAPPADAVVFDDVQNTKNTGSCDTASCAGGSGSGTSWVAFNQTTPSLSGSSTEFLNSGTGFDTLWYWHLGANNSI